MSTMWTGWGDETRRLLRLLAQSERGNFGWPPAVAWDWRNFAQTCDTHRVTPYVYCRLQGLTETDVPVGLLEHLRTRFQEVCARNYHLAKKLVDLIPMLENEGIPALAYKGPALAMAVYGGLAFRHYNDLDLVIHKEHHAKAVHTLTGWGFQIVPKPALPRVRPYLGRPEDPRNVERTQEIEFCAPDSTYYLDLHWQLGDRFWRPFNPDVEKLWERAEWQNLPEGRVSTLCREDLFLALCAHGNVHRWLCLKWLLDVAELLRKAETLDWSRVEEMVRIRPGAAASASVAVTLARDLLEVTVPPRNRTNPPSHTSDSRPCHGRPGRTALEGSIQCGRAHDTASTTSAPGGPNEIPSLSDHPLSRWLVQRDLRSGKPQRSRSDLPTEQTPVPLPPHSAHTFSREALCANGSHALVDGNLNQSSFPDEPSDEFGPSSSVLKRRRRRTSQSTSHSPLNV
jgi:hypothetical protein